MRPHTRYPKHEPGLLKPHTVVCTYARNDFSRSVVFSYYEVLGLYEGGTQGKYRLAVINEHTGATVEYCSSGYADLELIAPTHPVYIKWAARRLQDRLEGLDRG